MKNVTFILLFVFLMRGSLTAQNIEFTAHISTNKITNFDNQKLILLDFWATWCGPCVAATKQMEIFQESNKDKVYIFSVTDETEKTVNKYLTKKPIALHVVLDQKKVLIEKYNVVSRPYAALIDLQGKLLWKGHPADLNQKLLNSFYEKSKNQTLTDLSELISYAEIQPSKVAVQQQDVLFTLKKETTAIDNVFEIEDSKVIYSGKLANLIAKIGNKSVYGIEIENSLNNNVSLVCSLSDYNNKEVLFNKICEKFELNIEEIEKMQFGNEIIIENKNLLWKNTQLDWENTPVNFMVGTDKITANDVSLNDFSVILSEAKNKNYVYNGDDFTTYDWDFQYLYDDLMVEDLQSTFGVIIKPSNFVQKITRVTKRN